MFVSWLFHLREMLPVLPFLVEVEVFLLTCQVMTSHELELETLPAKQAEGWMHLPPLCPCWETVLCEGLHVF